MDSDQLFTKAELYEQSFPWTIISGQAGDFMNGSK